MAKKPKSEEAGEPNYGTGSIKIDPKLAWKARMIAEFKGTSISKLIDPLIRQFIESEYRAFVRDAEKVD